MIYEIKLIEKREVARETMEFTLEKPEGFMYQSGQTIDLTLVDPKETDSKGNIRTFSLVSAPHEPVLKIAMRLRDSAFKRVMRSLDEDAFLCLEGPFGSFGLHKKVERPAIFIAGGIGITPFYSMINDATERKLENKIILFYSNNNPEDSAFLTELQNLEKQNSNFKLVATITNTENENEDWLGERGRINEDMIKKYLPENTSPIYYLVGPQAMVEAMREMLDKMGVDSDDIRFEEFAGY
ncbi:MAG: Methane monooxygenase component C [Parcubacteria bacterium OLB19]|nr:MAG: Methane monooxygenase component C [Parcubacteria bacterium OLB19]